MLTENLYFIKTVQVNDVEKKDFNNWLILVYIWTTFANKDYFLWNHMNSQLNTRSVTTALQVAIVLRCVLKVPFFIDLFLLN